MHTKVFLNTFRVLLFITGVWTFQQDDYDLRFERLEVNEYDKKIVTHAKTHNFKHNRTTTAVNISVSISQNLPPDVQIEVQAYKMASNEYHLFPLRFMFSFCDACAINDFGLGGLYKCGNLTKCPIQKGHFFICNWAAEGKKFPPHIPNGSYRVDLKFLVGNEMILFLELYGTITRPVV